MSSNQPAHHFAAALSELRDTREAVEEVCQQVQAQLPTKANLVLVFFSFERAGEAQLIARLVCERLGTRNVLGCCGESVVGTGREIEGRPALSVWAAAFGGEPPETFHLSFARTPDGGTFLGWPDTALSAWPDGTCLLALGEPFTFPADYFLEQINENHGGTHVVGGMASGGAAPGECRLILGEQVVDSGAVVARLDASAGMRSVVSQGCRPIGRPFVVTQAERNVIFELGGQTALAQLTSVFEQLPNHEKVLFQQGLHVGRVVSEYQEQFEQGDFLIRNVIGIDSQQGAIAIGDYIRTGQTVQFHIRDQTTADDEMRQLLARHQQQHGPPAAALLFTCNGRGTRLFDQPDHDAGLIAAVAGTIPAAGFFAQGEMGPVGGRNFLHGFTASMALFGARTST